ncbi:hypothetical protein BGY98DRAFT_1016013, partial [Russula aff. rugulosa BPL654]
FTGISKWFRYYSSSGWTGHRNDARVARLLIAHGADPNSRTRRLYATAFASICGRIEIVRLLIEHGANVEAKDDWVNSIGRCVR